jgi:DNA-binding response OmpR family regulator
MACILLIEDDDPLRTVLWETLTSHGHAVTEARNGREGLALQAARAFDLLILDILMPERDGLEVLQELRGRISGLKIIVISGGGRGAALLYLDLAALLGAHRTLQKPFTGRTLLQAIDELCPGAGPDRAADQDTASGD